MDDIDEIARRVAHSHAYEKHVQGRADFSDATRGPPVSIESVDDLQKHIRSVLTSSETWCATLLQEAADDPEKLEEVDIFYHPPSNTTVIVPGNPKQQATALRSWRGINFFFNKCSQHCLDTNRMIFFSKSIFELEEEKKLFNQMKEAVDQRFEKEKKCMQERQKDELKRSPDAGATAERHAKELRMLERHGQQDFERYRREHENTRRLRQQDRERAREAQETLERDGPERGSGPRR